MQKLQNVKQLEVMKKMIQENVNNSQWWPESRVILQHISVTATYQVLLISCVMHKVAMRKASAWAEEENEGEKPGVCVCVWCRDI